MAEPLKYHIELEDLMSGLVNLGLAFGRDQATSDDIDDQKSRLTTLIHKEVRAAESRAGAKEPVMMTSTKAEKEFDKTIRNAISCGKLVIPASASPTESIEKYWCVPPDLCQKCNDRRNKTLVALRHLLQSRANADASEESVELGIFALEKLVNISIAFAHNKATSAEVDAQKEEVKSLVQTLVAAAKAEADARFEAAIGAAVHTHQPGDNRYLVGKAEGSNTRRLEAISRYYGADGGNPE